MEKRSITVTIDLDDNGYQHQSGGIVLRLWSSESIVDILKKFESFVEHENGIAEPAESIIKDTEGLNFKNAPLPESEDIPF